MGSGVLDGLRVVEFAGQGPAPFCSMLLADHGADVLRIDRIGGHQLGAPFPPRQFDILGRGKRSVALNLKEAPARMACLALFEKADAVIEGFRPGVMERLGLGPDVALSRNPAIAYGRMTGWGQTGPMSTLAGHDLNYIAITGAAHSIGSRERPSPPLNLVGDFGGGALYLAFGVLAAVLNAHRTGVGQVIDCAMSDGAASLMSSIYSLRASGQWTLSREDNIVDGGAHFYNLYSCSDGLWICVAAIEPAFYRILLEKTGLQDPGHAALHDRSRWPAMREQLAELFSTKTRPQWCEIMRGADACFAPVLDLDEAPNHPQNDARGTFAIIDGVVQPSPAPRFSRTPGAIRGSAPAPGAHNVKALSDWGVPEALVEELFPAGADSVR